MAPATRFWRISSPDYESDYRDSYINGGLDYPFGLPGVHCDVCGQTWGGCRVLSYECPESLKSHKNFKERWPVSRSEHTALQQQLFAALGARGEPFIDLRPGDTLQPCYLDIPSRPRADFLWPYLGVLVVSGRIKDFFLNTCCDEISVRPIVLRKVGKRQAELPPPMPTTGEPEDIINEVPLLSDPVGVGPYYQIIPLHESEYPRDRLPKIKCSGCQRVDVKCVFPLPEIRMAPDMWRGHNIFHIGSTLSIVITDKVREALLRYRPTNVNITDASCGRPGAVEET